MMVIMLNAPSIQCTSPIFSIKCLLCSLLYSLAVVLVATQIALDP